MGLDMFLYRCVKIDGWTTKDYSEVSNLVSKIDMKEYDHDPSKVNLKELCNKPNVELIKIIIKNDIWFGIFDKVAYWRKANHIHRWFVKNVQEDNDDCGCYFVSEDQLKSLKDICDKIIDDFLMAPNMLPTQSGFFFGNTSYNFEYLEDVKDTCKILENVLETTDFKNQIIIYSSSW